MSRNGRSLIDAYFAQYDTLAVTAFNITGDKEIALDVLQDIALMLIEKGEALDEIKYKSAFLHTCVRNKAIDIMRKNARSSPMDPQEFTQPNPGVQEAIRFENKSWLEAYLTSFPPELREAFIMHVLDGHLVKELAAELGISPNALAQYFRRMKAKIRQQLKYITK